MELLDTEVQAAADNTPLGKLIGVVENRDQLHSVSEALKLLGVLEVQVLEGPAGIVVLDAWTKAVAGFILGDMEAEMVGRFHKAARNGGIVLAAVVAPETVVQAAEAVKASGATEVTHFGSAAITNY